MTLTLDSTRPTNTYYCMAQYADGFYFIFGVGTTKDAAYSYAVDSASDVIGHVLLPCSSDLGCLVCYPCTKDVYLYTLVWGGNARGDCRSVKFDVVDGIMDLLPIPIPEKRHC